MVSCVYLESAGFAGGWKGKVGMIAESLVGKTAQASGQGDSSLAWGGEKQKHSSVFGRPGPQEWWWAEWEKNKLWTNAPWDFLLSTLGGWWF